MLASLPSFLVTQSLSLYQCKILYIVLIFFLLCLNSFLDHIKNSLDYYFFFFLLEFFTPALSNGFIDKSPQISMTLLSILADLNNAVVWTVSIRPFISKSSSPCTNILVTVQNTPITTDIIVNFIFQSFFFSLF